MNSFNKATDKFSGKVAVVAARFNQEVTDKLLSGCVDRLSEAGLSKDKVVVYRVPGAFEIPLIAKALLEQGVKGVVALGAVIRGDTTHYDYVCASVERGCTELQLNYGKPVVFGVLTTENEEQAFDRVGGSHGHKGRDAADTLIEMIELLTQINPKES
ncbi:MAG: 6,7-dimethyl-8-ribityllumazine synthase [Bdellovibrionota bacterium]